MTRIPGGRPAGTGHLTEEELLRYLDGELPARRSAQVRRHIEACWQCRASSEKISQAIVRFVDCRNAAAEQMPPPGNWAGFEARLRAARAAAPVAASKWRLPNGSLRWLRFVAAAASVALVLVWLRGSFQNTLSAGEILLRAESAAAGTTHVLPHPVVHQKIRLKRSSGRHVNSALVDSWSDVDGRRQAITGDDEVVNDLRAVLGKNRLKEHQLLSASAYDAWRDRLRDKREHVTTGRMADGSEVLSINTVSNDSPEASDAILEARLVVRTRDWHPIEQEMRVRRQSEIRDFELLELSFDVTARNTVDPAVFGETVKRATVATPRAHHAAPAMRLAEPAPDLDQAEILTEEVLHRTGGCLGESLEIHREEHRVVVRGVVESGDRRQALAAAFGAIPFVQAEIQTVEEALRSSVPEPATVDAAPQAGAATPSDHGTPAEHRWKNRLSATEWTTLSNRMVSLSSDWLAHAWALRRLEEAWPAEKIGRLQPSSRAILERLVREHSSGLRETARLSRAALAPLLSQAETTLPDGDSAATAEISWPEEARVLLENAQAGQRLIYSLFTESNLPGASADDALARLAGSLADVDTRSRRLETGVAQLAHKSQEIGSFVEKSRP